MISVISGASALARNHGRPQGMLWGAFPAKGRTAVGLEQTLQHAAALAPLSFPHLDSVDGKLLLGVIGSEMLPNHQAAGGQDPDPPPGAITHYKNFVQNPSRCRVAFPTH